MDCPGGQGQVYAELEAFRNGTTHGGCRSYRSLRRNWSGNGPYAQCNCFVSVLPSVKPSSLPGSNPIWFAYQLQLRIALQNPCHILISLYNQCVIPRMAFCQANRPAAPCPTVVQAIPVCAPLMNIDDRLQSTLKGCAKLRFCRPPAGQFLKMQRDRAQPFSGSRILPGPSESESPCCIKS